MKQLNMVDEYTGIEKRFTKAIVCLLSVVLGALILAGLYALMDGQILPTLSEKITEMFNYSN